MYLRDLMHECTQVGRIIHLLGEMCAQDRYSIYATQRLSVLKYLNTLKFQICLLETNENLPLICEFCFMEVS